MTSPGTAHPTPARALSPAAVRRGWWVIVLAVLAVGAVFAIRPMNSPPLYDGVGFPDEPYRWVQPPAGAAKTPAVTPAVGQARVGLDGTMPVVKGLSEEQGPQIAFQIEQGDLVAPKGVAQVTVRAEAGPNPSVLPPDGTLVSNLYTLSASGDKPGELSLAPGKSVIINMRADKATPDPVVLQVFADGAWTQIATAQVGTEIYAARVEAFGQFALVRLNPGVQPSVAFTPRPGEQTQAAGGNNQPAPADSVLSGPLLYIAAGALVLLLLLGLFIARRRMSS